MGAIYFICTGNTCRSPLAEAFARELYTKAEFQSRGLHSPGGGASAASVRVMSEIYGIDISGHVSRQLKEEDVLEARLLLTMSASHLRQIVEKYPIAADKAFTLRDFVFKDKGGDIADPFMGDFDTYAGCAAAIKECIDRLDDVYALYAL